MRRATFTIVSVFQQRETRRTSTLIAPIGVNTCAKRAKPVANVGLQCTLIFIYVKEQLKYQLFRLINYRHLFTFTNAILFYISVPTNAPETSWCVDTNLVVSATTTYTLIQIWKKKKKHDQLLKAGIQIKQLSFSFATEYSS